MSKNEKFLKVELNANKTSEDEKNRNRTHHTSFFEKLYGNLEKSSHEEKSESESLIKSITGDAIIRSPSESSGSLSSDINVERLIIHKLDIFVIKC